MQSLGFLFYTTSISLKVPSLTIKGLKMKYIVWLILSLALIACSNKPISTESYLKDSRHTAKNFMQELGGTLKSQIKTSGIESAIPVCKEIAPAIATKYSQTGKQVKRVSTKARNISQGTPDAWELAALQAFEDAIKQDKSVTQLEKAEVVRENGTHYYRYAKGIRVKPVCLNCHGADDNIAPSVKAVLAEHYPNDVATGYLLGDLRGAISIKQKLN